VNRISPANGTTLRKVLDITGVMFCASQEELQEELAEAEVDWISPLHDHARVSFTIGDTVWGNIQPPKPALAPQRTSQSDKLKLEQMLPVRSVVDETCTSLALKFLDPQNQLSSIDSVHRLLETRRSLFAILAPT
jgi:hypothetical protein